MNYFRRRIDAGQSRYSSGSFILLIICMCGLVFSTGLTAAEFDFEREVAPILIRRCLECHQTTNASGGLSLDSAAGLLNGGDSGPTVTANNLSESLLLLRVSHGEMPPAHHGVSQALPEPEVELLRKWILAGATFPADRKLDIYERTNDARGGRDWWSFQPLRHVTPPWSLAVPADSNPIDAFVQAALAEHGLTAAPPALREHLARRLYWTTTGLPATETQLATFVSDHSTDATERLVLQLLQSPHFGERWARHWLDVVRFAETSGYERDQTKPFAWKYRDWVVNAINSDMPWDQFIREQLAGDVIENRSDASVIATGFLRLGTWNDEPNDPEDYKYEQLEDLVHVTSSAFLALTTKCARCHDHKFDPIPQTDYYHMAAAFWTGPVHPRDRTLLGGPSTEELGIADVLGWTDVNGTTEPLRVLKNGDRHRPLQDITFAVPTYASFVKNDSSQSNTVSESTTSSGRLQLANWIANPRNPLTARVVVNRLWQHHFGEGLVRSSNNFGFTGDKPTHPELLDWLALELIQNNWSLKHIHRLILTSATWQQASIHPMQTEYAQIDAANRFLWHANRRRLEAESIRDALLAGSGELDLRIGGPSFYPTISPDALEGLSRKAAAWNASPENEQHRRSLYIFTQRSLLPPLMTTFDLCDTTTPCSQRDVTIVAPQALTLLNNEFVHRRSEHLASRIAADGAKLPVDRATAAWRAILNRPPSKTELQLAVSHLEYQTAQFQLSNAENSDSSKSPEQLALASLCLVLFNSSEFIYVD